MRLKYLFLKLRTYLFPTFRIEQSTLAGKNIKAIPGTIRIKVDKDTAWFVALAKNNKKIFDLGANVGYPALLAHVFNPQIDKYLLADPNPMALGFAAQNLILNGFSSNATFINAFISDKHGDSIPFYTVEAGEAGSMFKSHAKTASKLNKFFMVNTTTIDQLIQEQGWIPDFIKVDVEGAESLVLEGAKALAARQTCILMVEMHAPDELPMITNARNVLSWCKENQYQAWYMKEKIRLEHPETIAHRGKCHLLLLPISENYPDYLLSVDQSAALPIA
jgi:FkbM family methyltransferase